MTSLRPELEPLPERMKSLPVHRGYPVPWFVAWLEDGTPEFRAMERAKWRKAMGMHLCWVCGGKLGGRSAFLIGPMCAINRTTSEPPCHVECAEWSARNCPFLARPHAVRREGDALAEEFKNNVAGESIKRNPGVSLVWVTKSFETFKDEKGGQLIQIGPQESVSWWALGRRATREEVEHSVDTGLPLLYRAIEDKEKIAAKKQAAYVELNRRHEAAIALYPEL